MNTSSSPNSPPKWSMHTSFWFCIIATAIVVPLITLRLQKSVWIELEVVTGVIAALMFVYFTIILHQGVRFTDTRIAIIDWTNRPKLDLSETLQLRAESSFFSGVGAEGGILGLFVGVLLDLLVTIIFACLLTALFWIGVNTLIAVILFLFWVHTRWLRYLVTTGRKCRGSWTRSALHGGLTTLRFSIWFFAAFAIAQGLLKMRSP